jgi:alpha-tubulin suppressor-like RCC1 family protein
MFRQMMITTVILIRKIKVGMMNRSKNWMVHSLLLAFLVIFVITQASPAFAATGAVTIWGGGYPTPQPAVALPAGVTPSFVTGGYDGAYAITNDGVYFWPGVVNNLPVKINFPTAVTLFSTISNANRNDLSLAITNDGVYSWGTNGRGQLGDGTYIGRIYTPGKVLLPAAVTSVTAIAAGNYHGLAVTNDGLYAWGDNTNGELGNGTRTSSPLPVKVALPASVTSVTAVAAGDNASYAVTNDGLYAWVNSSAGQLGIGPSVADQLLPVKVLFITNTKKGTTTSPVTSVTAVAAGQDYALALTNDGLYAWGANGYGQLGNGTTTNAAYPTKVQFGKNTVITVKAISAGTNHNLAVTSNGLYAWGSNANGKLGPVSGTGLTPAKVPGEDGAIQAAAGDYFSVALH